MLVDEAYYPFYPQSILALIHKFPHLIVARTFSKAWGLAGIRLGYGIAQENVMHQLHKVRSMYEAGTLSLGIASRALDFSKDMIASVGRLNKGKQYFLSEMHQLGFTSAPTEANFLHINFKDHAENIHAMLKETVLYRAQFSHPALAKYSRFTSTTQDMFAPVVQIIKTILKK